ncbi:SOS response-associated peptidase [Butyrivibrio sp. WCD2001]|uniref:SOS response-associated peptidase n=1 Tax=Butyrivibrio sp. WCD2001 TaxID=1280681 RepID=UPI000428CFD3|nr:SOS response-associated peptidase [Butyrivibrio sp. WCD2001]
MCGRYYYADKTAKAVEIELQLPYGTLILPAGDIVPGKAAIALLLGKETADIKVCDLHWGLTTKDKKLVINARAESVLEKPMFSESIKSRRCILPAGGFYEWNRDKTKYTFTSKDGNPLYLAGFYDMSDNRDSFVILTTEANSSMSPVHDRMPVIIDKKNVREYLCESSAALDMIKEKMPELERKCDYKQLSLF